MNKRCEVPIDLLPEYLELSILNNRDKIEMGYSPRALELTGDTSVGKTTSVYEVSKSLNIPVFRLQLATNESPMDVNGIPITKYEFESNTNETAWYTKEMFQLLLDNEYKFTGNVCTVNSPPETIVEMCKTEEAILLIDDWTRANPLVTTGIMELINEGKHEKWGKLPKYLHVILTSNPDENGNKVTYIDTAEKSRMDTIYVTFNINSFCVKYLSSPELVYLDMYVRQEDPFKDILPREFINIIPIYRLYLENKRTETQFEMSCKIHLGDVLGEGLIRYLKNMKVPTIKELLEIENPEEIIKTYTTYFGDGQQMNRIPLITVFTKDLEKNYSGYTKKETIELNLTDKEASILEYIVCKFVPKDLQVHLAELWFNKLNKDGLDCSLRKKWYIDYNKDLIQKPMPNKFEIGYPYLVKKDVEDATD